MKPFPVWPITIQNSYFFSFRINSMICLWVFLFVFFSLLETWFLVSFSYSFLPIEKANLNKDFMRTFMRMVWGSRVTLCLSTLKACCMLKNKKLDIVIKIDFKHTFSCSFFLLIDLPQNLRYTKARKHDCSLCQHIYENSDISKEYKLRKQE